MIDFIAISCILAAVIAEYKLKTWLPKFDSKKYIDVNEHPVY